MDTTVSTADMSNMDLPETIDINLLRDLLCSSWMRHDAMWFYHCSKGIGMELTNKINRAAIRDMGLYEGRKLKEALGYKNKTLQTFEEFEILLKQMFSIISSSFMKGTLEFLDENKIRMSWQNCFAHAGVSRMGLIDSYECGIFDRVDAWLDTLDVNWEVNPKISQCMKYQQGYCFREYTIHFYDQNVQTKSTLGKDS